MTIGKEWPEEKRQRFLDHLAATCNVKESAVAGEIHKVHLYQVRRDDAAFREQWREALQAGYEMLETLVVGHALQGGGRTVSTGLEEGGVDIDLAMRLLTQHRNALNGKPNNRRGPPLRRARPEETDAAILAKLDAIDRARAAAED